MELFSTVSLDWEITSCISEEEREEVSATLSATELLSIEEVPETGL